MKRLILKLKKSAQQPEAVPEIPAREKVTKQELLALFARHLRPEEVAQMARSDA